MEELQKLEELISLLYQDKLTQYGKRLLVVNIEKLQKENEELRAKWDKDTHILQNKLDYANADRIDLAQQNKEYYILEILKIVGGEDE